MKNNKTNWGLRGTVILLALIIFVAAGNRNDTYAKTKEENTGKAVINDKDDNRNSADYKDRMVVLFAKAASEDKSVTSKVNELRSTMRSLDLRL